MAIGVGIRYECRRQQVHGQYKNRLSASDQGRDVFSKIFDSAQLRAFEKTFRAVIRGRGKRTTGGRETDDGRHDPNAKRGNSRQGDSPSDTARSLPRLNDALAGRSRTRVAKQRTAVLAVA